MNVQELKQKLHQQVDVIDDELTLSTMEEAATEYGIDSSQDGDDELTPAQWRRLEESRWQLRNGFWKSHEEVMEMLETWLKK